MASKKSSGLSITTVTSLVLVLALYLGWGFLAASYVAGTSTVPFEDVESDDEEDSDFNGMPRRRMRMRSHGSLIAVAVAGVIKFVETTVTQLPNLPSVFIWHLTHRLWLLIVVFLMPILVVAGGFGMKHVEQQLEGPPKKRKVRKIVLPRGE